MRAIESIAVIGAGNMGSGIAQKSATEGFDVQMVDREQKWVDRGQATIDGFLQEAIERRIFRPEQAEQIKSKVTGFLNELIYFLFRRFFQIFSSCPSFKNGFKAITNFVF